MVIGLQVTVVEDSVMATSDALEGVAVQRMNVPLGVARIPAPVLKVWEGRGGVSTSDGEKG